jgi:L-fucose isomerase-like protein
MSAPAVAPTVALVSIARPTFDVPLAQAVAQTAAAQIAAGGMKLTGPQAALIMDAAGVEAALAQLARADFDLLVLLQASFADSTMAVQLAAVAQAARVPILLWAVPDSRDGGRLRLNSLCGINLAGHALTLRGIPYDYLLAPADDDAAAHKIGVLARAGQALRRLRGATLGLVGQHPAGFDTCAYEADDLARLFGVGVAEIELDAILQAARQAPEAPRQAFLARAGAAAHNISDMDVAATRGTAGVYVALQGAVAERGLAGVAVRCWPEFFTELGCAACGAMSLLNQDRCPASCEADVNGTLTSLLLQTLSGGPAFITDLVSIEAESDSGVFWHCGLAPFDMADPQVGVAATVHSNRKLPLLFEFPLKPGRITLARLHRCTGAGCYQLVIGGGEMVRAERPFGGACGVVRFDQAAPVVLDRILAAGLEHHFSITYGDVRAELAAAARLVGLPVLELTA